MYLGEYLSQAQWIAKTLIDFHPSISLDECIVLIFPYRECNLYRDDSCEHLRRLAVKRSFSQAVATQVLLLYLYLHLYIYIVFFNRGIMSFFFFIQSNQYRENYPLTKVQTTDFFEDHYLDDL